jgi:hypothetical protein
MRVAHAFSPPPDELALILDLARNGLFKRAFPQKEQPR